MVAFAANSVLARLALEDRAIDPASYVAVRLGSGALVLAALAAALGRGRGGTWSSAALLFVYAAGFAFAYLSLGAGTGALLLFAVVQVSMIGAALARGERPGRAALAGWLAAAAGLVYLAAPGLSAPDPLGAALMAAAGLAWAGYTLRGRAAGDPIAATAGNFVRATPLAALLLAAPLLRGELHATPRGLVLAALSGAIASGLGYVLWYRAVPRLSRVQAGVVQLTPAPLAAAGGLLLIGEPITPRLLAAALLILGGVAVAIAAARR